MQTTSIQLLRTNSANQDFIKLVQLLDADLALRDGDDHAFYHQFNGIDTLKHCIVCYADGIAAACGAIKPLDESSVEVKRMYVAETQRRKGFAVKVLACLEEWAAELGYNNIVLETGINQPEAIALYKKSNYSITENYGQYAGVSTSICFAKELRK